MDMRMPRILIPSRGRWDCMTTIDNLSSEFYPSITIYVPVEELDQYKDSVYHGLFGIEVLAVSNYSDTIGRKRELMAVDHFSRFPTEPNFIMMDDDLVFSRRNDEGKLEKINNNFFGLMEMFGAWVDKHEIGGFAATGISLRQGNNNLPDEGDINTRCIRCVMFDRAAFLGVEHNRVAVMEDFDIMLQLLRQGRDNHVIAMYAQDQKGTGADGGCSATRTKQVHEQSAEKLAELHRPFVKTRLKVNKTGPEEMRERKEVTIYWKKARASADT